MIKMKRYHGSIRVESNFKEDWHYFIVESSDLIEATSLAKEKFKQKGLIPIDIKIGIYDEEMEAFLARGGTND
jgi:hypothetical protein